ncbi:hypothetical protein TWF102_008065 [Orbilia oligospora]|uniref:Grh/CP2 DB domain-containing protein n=2 Tax=Orbilia oligospora TaxID=2813651 RepID=A0A7C8NDR0_ORBOL|nr:hypothetical protein TWF102_008065 [Orbilia oligospora]KAF3121360.1 hypothetical protein TWF703_001952 [Orbilia oligospora]KAF3123045.1 hypothetical protein TWF594_002552 [Orbilia oligospora]
MFRNRQSSQKPPDELFEKFRLSFPDVTSTAGEQLQSTANGIHELDMNPARFGHEDLDPTPRAAAEPFRFTPSLLDPTSAAFAAFANQPPGYYTPTPGNPQPPPFSEPNVDLQTPSIGIGIGPPITAAPNATLLNTTQAYPTHAINPQQFHNYHPFLAPSLHQDYALHNFDAPASPKGSPMEISGREDEINEFKQVFNVPQVLESRQGVSHPGAEQFRFHVTLNAPTAMIRHHDEIPVTYLNKGQAYTISIIDTSPSPPVNGGVRYRTFIRISFQDEGQRQRAATCWQLWKEGRGTNEAHQRGGKLQAVEYVSTPMNGEDEKKRGRMEVDTASFDGFSVLWTPALGAFETVVSVRFNFLSTDFSHSKGVKGIPVRLCAKTEILTSDPPPQTSNGQAEVCYCKVKLFRDHGAERKLANDILHVKKTMDKLKQQADASEESGSSKKRKDSMASNKSSNLESGKPGKAAKHKRTWSISSASSTGGNKVNDDDINQKINALQDMFTSTRPVSVLYLRGEEQDDPDLYPVHLPGESHDSLDENWMRRPSAASMMSSASASSFVSPSPSSASLPSHHDFQAGDQTSPENFRSVSQRFAPNEITRVKTSNDAGILAGWIEAIGIDPSYVPPADRQTKPIMCVYVLNTMVSSGADQNYYKAVYLRERSETCLTNQIAMKCGLDPTHIRRVIRIDARGLHSIVDDDVVREMKEGQDMKVQFLDISNAMLSPPQTEWAPEMNEESKDLFDKGWEMRLCF